MRRTTSATILAISIFTAATGAGTPHDMAVAGIKSYNSKDYDTAFQLLSAAADKGDTDAEVNLGYMYARGEGAPHIDGEALRLYQLSADHGNGEGMNALAYKYAFGTGVPVDLPTAIKWFCRAIATGDARALNNLGDLYFNGTGVEYDHLEARDLWRQAAEKNDVNAMYNFASAVLKDHTSTPDELRDANAWMLRAAQGGQSGAIDWLHEDGYRGALPEPVDTTGLMQLAAVGARPGTARVCTKP